MIYSKIKHSQLWCESTPSISEVAQQMKSRTAQIYHDWNRDNSMAGPSRSGMNTVINCQTFQGDLSCVSEAIQLKDVICNQLICNLCIH